MTLTPEDRVRRESAAKRFKPEIIRLLLVGEAPPSHRERYFYFTEVSDHDSLFRYVNKGIFGRFPTREKAPFLAALRDRGVFLIDLGLDPVTDHRSLGMHVPDLIQRCQELQPGNIILIKATVYDVAFSSLRVTGLPVIDRRIPFPGSGQQRKFESEFAAALNEVNW